MLLVVAALVWPLGRSDDDPGYDDAARSVATSFARAVVRRDFVAADALCVPATSEGGLETLYAEANTVQLVVLSLAPEEAGGWLLFEVSGRGPEYDITRGELSVKLVRVGDGWRVANALLVKTQSRARPTAAPSDSP